MLLTFYLFLYVVSCSAFRHRVLCFVLPLDLSELCTRGLTLFEASDSSGFTRVACLVVSIKRSSA